MADDLTPPVGEGIEEDLVDRETSSFEEVRDGGYGVGSAAPVWDRVMPLGHPIKGTTHHMEYFVPGGQWYEQVVADVWFTDEETAVRFGYHRSGDV